MQITKKVFALFVSAVVLVSAAVCIGAAGSGELSITAKNAGSGQLEIKIQNVSEYYLGNVNVKVSPVSGSGAKVDSFGIGSATGEDSVYSVEPGKTVTAYAKVSSSNKGNSQTTTNTTAATKKPPKSTTTQKNTGNTDPSQVIPEPVETDAVTVDTVTGTADETSASGETSDKKTEKDTEAESVHSETGDDSETIVADVSSDPDVEGSSDVTDSDKATDGNDKESSSLVWIIPCAAAAVIGAAVVVVVIKKKKKITKDISAVIVLAVLLGVFASANGGVNAADGITVPTAGSVSKTVDLGGGKGSVQITVDYLIAPKPVVQELKNKRRAPSSDECNNGNTPVSAVVEGAGPLTGFNIYVGKNDMLFFGDAIKDYKGQTIMNNARLNKLTRSMNARDTWAKENGIKLYLVIAPNKTSVYPDYVPESVRAAAKTNTDTVVEYLAANSTVEVIDLRETLKSARSTYGDDLFYNYDTHWNQNGGFVAYTEIMRRINEDVPGAITLGKNQFDISTKETYMKDMAWYFGHYSNSRFTDYGPMYTLKSGMTATITSRLSSDAYDWHGQFQYCYKWSDGYADSLKNVSYENKFNVGAPSLYMYRDSFSVSMLHFFKDSFHKSTFDWSYEFSQSEILRSGANVVIMEVVEKQLLEFTNKAK